MSGRILPARCRQPANGHLMFLGKGSSHVAKSCVRHVVRGRPHCRFCQRQADTTSWDAVAGYHTDENTSSDTWQYLRVWNHTTGYEPMSYFDNLGGGASLWAGTRP